MDMKGIIYKAKMAKRPARPAPAMRAEFMSAAPVAWGLAPEPEPDAPAEAEAVARAELVAEAAALAAPPDAVPAGPAGAAPGMFAVWLLGKRLLMQASTHLAKASEAGVEPSPWSHLAAHSLVAIAWLALGRALPKHAAWQVTSPASHARAQLTAGVRPEGTAAGAGALVTVASWGMAKAPTTKRRTAEYFMMTVDGCRLLEAEGRS